MPAASDVVDAAGVADAAASDAVAPYVDAMLMGLLVPMGPLTPMRLLMLMGLLTPGGVPMRLLMIMVELLMLM